MTTFFLKVPWKIFVLKSVVFSLVALLWGMSSDSSAGINQWTSNGWPEGGTVLTLAIDPLTPTTIYAGAPVGIYKSTNGGSTWTLLKNDLIFNSIAIDPVTPTTIYAGTSGNGIYMSTNGGSNWSQINSYSGIVNAIAVDPATPSTIYAGISGYGIIKSKDRGNSWSYMNTGLTNSTVMTIAIDPTTPSTLYVGTWGGGLHKSTDSGSAWNPINTGISNSYISSVVIDPASNSTIYAGTTNGIFKTTNGGTGWNTVNTGLTSTGVKTLVIDPMTPTTLYVGLYSGAVFKTTNAGANWGIAATGLTANDVKSLAIDPKTPATLFTASTGGIFKTNDGGSSWSTMNSGLTANIIKAFSIDPVTNSTIYAGTWGGVYKCTNGSTNCALMNSGLTSPVIYTLAINPLTPSTIYAGGNGFFKSTNSATNWTPMVYGMTNTLVNALAINPLMPDTLYAGTAGGVFKTINGGSNWTSKSFGLTNTDIRSLVINPLSTTTLYAGTSNSGVFKSTNGGDSWSPVNSAMPNAAIDTLAIDPANPDIIYAGAWGGIYKTTNGGTNWTYVNLHLTTYVRSIAIDPQKPTTLYIGTSGEGVFRSTNGVTSWSSMNQGLTNMYANSLAVDPVAPENIYAGIYGSGAFSYSVAAPPACGSSNLKTLPTAPSANLCDAGTPSAVTGSGPWSWSCSVSGDPAYCVANSPSVTFSQSDLTGRWETNSIASGPGAPWWGRGSFTVAADGSATGTFVESDNSTDSISTTLTLAADGTVTVAGANTDQLCKLDSSKTIITCTDTWSSWMAGTVELFVMTKMGPAYALSDLQGTWESHALGTPGPYWSHGSFTVAVDGTTTATVIQDNGSTTNFSGSFSMPSSGIFTLTSPQLQPIEQATMRCALDSLKTVMVCTNSHDSSGSLETTMTILVKKAPAYSQADLTGAWHVDNLVSPTNPWWGRGMFAIASDGSFVANMNGSDGPGDVMSFTGTSTFNANGNFAFDGVPTMHCSMDAAKRLVACTNTSTTGSGDATILVMTAATAPSAGQCGSSNGGTFTSAPSTGLCSAGLATLVNGTGPWTWGCQGNRGGGDASCSADITRWNLDVTISGRGTVTSDPVGISCISTTGATCSASFSHGTPVNLMSTGSNSSFSSWSGDLSGNANPGSITLDSAKSVTATFMADPARVHIDGSQTPYYTIDSALGVCGQGGTIRAQAAPLFAETITMTNPATILFRGGFTDPAFTDNSQSGFSTISGWLKIRSGKLTAERVKIQP